MIDSFRRILPACTLILAFGSCAPALHFRNVRLLESRFDPEIQGTAVVVEFEVWRNGEQLGDLQDDQFRAFENGIPAVTESLDDPDRMHFRRPVTLLLDTSMSMYEANAIRGLKGAAQRLRDQLTEDGFRVEVQTFARTRSRSVEIESIPGRFGGDPSERWTSLYQAVSEAAYTDPTALLVLFSDGADNYSPAEMDSIADVVSVVDDLDTIVHAIGFGNVAQEYDREGTPAESALRALSKHGSYRYATSNEDIQGAFDDIAQTIQQTYRFTYISPNLLGEHSLQIEVDDGGERARTKPLGFSGRASLDSIQGDPALLRRTLDGRTVFGFDRDSTKADIGAWRAWPTWIGMTWGWNDGVSVTFHVLGLKSGDPTAAVSQFRLQSVDEEEPLTAWLGKSKAEIRAALGDIGMWESEDRDTVSTPDGWRLPHYDNILFHLDEEGVCQTVSVYLNGDFR